MMLLLTFILCELIDGTARYVVAFSFGLWHLSSFGDISSAHAHLKVIGFSLITREPCICLDLSSYAWHLISQCFCVINAAES